MGRGTANQLLHERGKGVNKINKNPLKFLKREPYPMIYDTLFGRHCLYLNGGFDVNR